MRHAAAARVKQRRATSPPPTEAERERIHFELELHQVELELQNESLLAIQTELRDALERYTDLYDFAPVGYLSLGPDGEMRQLNLTAATLLGSGRSRLVNRRLGLFLSLADRAGFADFLGRVFAGQRQACEVALSESPLVVRLEAARTPSGQECRAVLTNITERQRVEAALREKEQQSRDVFEHAPVGIFHSVPGGRFLSANPALARMLGYASPEELIAATSDMTTQLYADPAVRPQIMAWIQETSGWVHRDAVAWRRKDGRIITVDMTGRKVCNAAGAIVYLEGFIVDVTERKQAEAALARVLAQRTEEWRQATSAALSASEEEARRIGQELHDTLCQDLIGIARQAEAAALAGVETERVPDAMADRLRRLASLAAAAARQARGLSYLLAVSEPLDGQLDESLRGHVRQLESLYDFTCDLPPDGVLPPWSTEQGVHIIRIVRESLVNAARHAHARRIWLDCLPEQGQTILSISSDGAPAPAPETWKPGLGLRQMRMRAALLGATLTFRPGPQGVVVQLALPEKS